MSMRIICAILVRWRSRASPLEPKMLRLCHPLEQTGRAVQVFRRLSRQSATGTPLPSAANGRPSNRAAASDST